MERSEATTTTPQLPSVVLRTSLQIRSFVPSVANFEWREKRTDDRNEVTRGRCKIKKSTFIFILGIFGSSSRSTIAAASKDEFDFFYVASLSLWLVFEFSVTRQFQERSFLHLSLSRVLLPHTRCWLKGGEKPNEVRKKKEERKKLFPP